MQMHFLCPLSGTYMPNWVVVINDIYPATFSSSSDNMFVNAELIFTAFAPLQLPKPSTLGDFSNWILQLLMWHFQIILRALCNMLSPQTLHLLFFCNM